MSPEQAEGEEPITASTDIFSLGCIIFEAAAHAVPFSDPSPIRALHKLLYDPAPKLREVATSAPARLQPVLDLCLAKKPGNRANSLVEIGEQLRQFLRSASQNQQGSPQRIGRRLSSALQGRRKIWVPAALSVLLLAAAAIRLTHAPSPSGSKASEPQISSLAVLPFTNASGAAGDNFISDGLSEGLINALSRLPHLKVVARASSFRFKGKGVNMLEVARTLGVQALLTGRIRDSRNQLDVNVQLTTGKDGVVLWAHQYRLNANDLTSTEDQIVRAVAARVRGSGSAAAETQLSESSEVVPEAYSLLLRGRYEMRLYNPQSTQKAVDYYREALAIDPGFALANAELANSYRLLSGAGILKPSDAMPLAEAAALRAIGNDARLAQAHAVLADIRRDQWNWRAAEAEYARALDLNPNLVSARTGFAIYLSLVQRVPEAVREATKARDLDPVGVPTSINAGAVYYNCRKYDEALRELERSTVLDPSASALWTWIGIVHGGSGHYPEAIQAYEKAMRLGDRTAATRCNYGYSLAKSGRRTEAQAILNQLQASKEFIPPTALAILYLGLGQDERAMDLLEQALSSRDQLVQYIGVESHFDQFHGSPRFQNLTAKLGLPLPVK
jgi:TolB-like protein/Tfp pilus assembly protein PilF